MIGAGLAGLQCATDLAAAGRDVVVVEARDRVGGRVLSHRFTNGQWCERGAELVEPGHTTVRSLAAQLGLEMCPVVSGHDDMAQLVDLGGRPAPRAYFGSLAADVLRWESALADLAAAIDLDDLPSTAGVAELDATPLSVLLDRLGLSVVGRVVIGRDVRSEYMVGPDEVSLLMAAWTVARRVRAGAHGLPARVVGGADQLAAGLAAPLADLVHLGAAVAWVDERSGEVVLRSGERWVAEHVVAAVPLPVLGRLWPALPPALAAVSYGLGGLVSVQVGRRIWRDQGRDGTVRGDRAVGHVWEASDGQAGDTGVLTALLSSHDGAMLVALPDREQRVVAEMDRIFPGARGLAGERVCTDWGNDPYSLGVRATFGPGRLLAARDAVQRRHGRLVLAGEHADVWAGSMEGALRSGSRAARAVLDAGG